MRARYLIGMEMEIGLPVGSCNMKLELDDNLALALLVAMGVTAGIVFAAMGCGDTGKISNQSYHCMTEGGDDYCRPQPISSGVTPIPGPPGAMGPQGPQGIPGTAGLPGSSGPVGADGIGTVTATQGIAITDYFCYYGGVRLRIARDTNRSGTWDQTDSEQQIVNVCNGLNGAPGRDGTNGHDGTNGVDGVNGSPGQNGSDGVDGADGRDGEDGSDTTSPFLPVELVDPCGDTPGVYDEVFLRLANGKLLSSFSDNANGQNTRFSILVPGNYITTDGSHCSFTVDSNNQIVGVHQ